MTKFSYLSIFVALLISGCSSASTQSPVQSADSASGSTQDQDYYSSADSSENEARSYESQYEPSRMTESETSTGSASEIQGDDGEDEVQTNYELTGLFSDQTSSAQAYTFIKDLGEFQGQALVPIAHFRRGSRQVVIAWPLLSSEGDVITSANVYGVCLEETSNGLEQCGIWEVKERASSTAALEAALGGSDYHVVNSQSRASLDDLGTNLTESGNAFVSAASQGESQAAFDAAQAFVGLLPIDEVAFDDFIAGLLVTASIHNEQFEYIKTEQGDLLSSVTFKVRRSWLEAKVMTLTAQQVDGSSNEWAVVDYW